MMDELVSPGSEATDLNALLAAAGLDPVQKATRTKFDSYLSLMQHWNSRINLTAIRDAESIMSRHFVESIACAQFLPTGIDSLLDFGSGAGFPGIPIALCRPEIVVTLAESQSKKAAFLQEAVRTLELTCKIWPRRAEELGHQFDCVILRAVDQMERAVAAAAELVKPGRWLAILTTQADLPRIQAPAGREFQWLEPFRLSGSDQRLICVASKASRSD
ncbi:MAG TPA: 16S rRNA (guanine(527)-N(7))-methyltransferase RsmG [Terracidiphilus sp.]|jgi:16S rRNA (guanine527-N7)-methyltransferase